MPDWMTGALPLRTARQLSLDGGFGSEFMTIALPPLRITFAGAAVGAAAAAVVASAGISSNIDRTFQVAAGGNVVVRTDFGDVDVRSAELQGVRVNYVKLKDGYKYGGLQSSKGPADNQTELAAGLRFKF